MLEELARAAKQQGLTNAAPKGGETADFAAASVRSRLGETPDAAVMQPLLALKDQLLPPFAKRVFLWPRRTGPKGDLVDDEMGRVLQVPGWSNIFTQPIINRIEMLSTGVRTDIGVKVFGPDLDMVDGVCKQVEAALKPLSGARDVIAAPIMGMGYLDIDINRDAAAVTVAIGECHALALPNRSWEEEADFLHGSGPTSKGIRLRICSQGSRNGVPHEITDRS